MLTECSWDYRENVVVRAAVELLGELANVISRYQKLFFQEWEFVKDLLRECLRSEDEQLKEVATWTQGMIGLE